MPSLNPVLLLNVALNVNGSVSSSAGNVRIFVMLINAVLSLVNSHSSDCHGSKSVSYTHLTLPTKA